MQTIQAPVAAQTTESPQQRAKRRERELETTIYDAYMDAGGPNRDGNRISDYSTIDGFGQVAGDVLDLGALIDDYGNTGEIPELEPLLLAIARGQPIDEKLLAPVRTRLHAVAEEFMERFERTHDFEAQYDGALAAAEVDRKIDALKG